MPQGIGTYGSKVGRPKKKDKTGKGILGTIGPSFAKGLRGLKKGDARESAIRRGGQKGRFSKAIGQLMTGKASPHTSRDESPIGRAMARARKYRTLMKKVPRTAKGRSKKKG